MRLELLDNVIEYANENGALQWRCCHIKIENNLTIIKIIGKL